MSSVKRRRGSEGVRVRHQRSCRTHDTPDGRCNCQPSYEAWVFLPRENRKLRKTFREHAAAKTWRADLLSAARRGEVKGPTKTTVRDAASELLAGMEDGSVLTRTRTRYKPAAIRGYRRGLDKHVLPTIGDRRLHEVTHNDLQDLVDHLVAAGLAASTVRNAMDPVRVIYRRAIKRGVVTVNPTTNLEIANDERKRDRIASATEAAQLLAALPTTERALWATAMYAGLRRGELRALRWGDIDLKSRRIHVSRGWDDDEGEQSGKTDAADRQVPIVPPLAALLAAHQMKTGRRDSDLVFGRTAEDPFIPSTVRNRALVAWGWEQITLKEAGRQRRTWRKARATALQPIGLHEARHTCASLFIASGANAKVIQTIMGHATIQMTFDRYGHLMPGGLEEAEKAVTDYLARAAG